MDESKKRYRVVVWDEEEYLKEFLSLPESQQVRVIDLFNNHLPHRPAQMKPPILKRLKGNHSHILQFDCGDKRLHYVIDEEQREVRIIGLGKHLEWEKRNKVGG